MRDLRELMEEEGFDPDHSEVDTLMQDQHYGSALTVGYNLLGEYDHD